MRSGAEFWKCVEHDLTEKAGHLAETTCKMKNTKQYIQKTSRPLKFPLYAFSSLLKLCYNCNKVDEECNFRLTAFVLFG